MVGVWPWHSILVPELFSEAAGQIPSPTNILYLPTAIEPQKEEADENCNSVNMRMRKTQVGLLSRVLRKQMVEERRKVFRDQVQPGDFPNGET